jgi:hypothetical protein
MTDDIHINSKEHNPYADTPEALILATRERVESILKNKFPEYLNFEGGSYTIAKGSTQVSIVVRPYTHDDTSIECTANVVYGAKITEDLMKFLLRKNAELHFGAFGLLFDGTISFSHSISGANLDENELENTLNSVATIADYYDDIIISVNGGKRATDFLGEFE